MNLSLRAQRGNLVARAGAQLRKSYAETRWASFGLIGNRVHHVVWTEREERIRIISLRKANRKEAIQYAEAVA